MAGTTDKEAADLIKRIEAFGPKTARQFERRLTKLMAEGAWEHLQHTTAFKDRTGELRDSFVVSTGTVKGTKIVKTKLRTPHARAWFLEFGHGGPRPAPPHPFIEDAAEAGSKRAFRRFRTEAGEVLRKAAARVKRQAAKAARTASRVR